MSATEQRGRRGEIPVKAYATFAEVLEAIEDGAHPVRREEFGDLSYEDWAKLDYDDQCTILNASYGDARRLVQEWIAEGERLRKEREHEEALDIWAERLGNRDDAAEALRMFALDKMARSMDLSGSTGTPAIKSSSSYWFAVDRLIKNGQVALLSGGPGTGKSAVATDLACRFAAKIDDWAGRKIDDNMAVIYVAAERYEETCSRIEAFKARHGNKHLPMYVLNAQGLDLSQSQNIDKIRELGWESYAATGRHSVFYIIDTLSASFGDGDQNSPKDMGNYVKSIRRLTDSSSTVLVIHHSGHEGTRPKGAVDLTGAADVSMFLKNRKGKISLDVIKANGVPEGHVAIFDMQIQAYDDGERTYEAPVMVHVTDPQPSSDPQTATSRTHQESETEPNELHALSVSFAATGQPTDKENLRKAFYALHPTMKADSLRKKFNRAFAAMPDTRHQPGQL